jgi:hypothetical protein
MNTFNIYMYAYKGFDSSISGVKVFIPYARLKNSIKNKDCGR